MQHLALGCTGVSGSGVTSRIILTATDTFA